MTMQNLGFQEAITRVLREAPDPLQPEVIARLIVQKKLKPRAKVTSVAAVLSSMVKEGTVIRPKVKHYQLSPQPPQPGVPVSAEVVREAEEEARLTNVSAYGLYWERDKVNWEPADGQLLGNSDDSDMVINFAEQWGIYILHNNLTVMYVGRTMDSLFKRLRQHHTQGRRTARWDEFSWFGFRQVNENGSLSSKSENFTTSMLVTVLESVMIEALLPPLNDRGGDLMGTMYRQVEDDELIRRQEANMRNIVARAMSTA